MPAVLRHDGNKEDFTELFITDVQKVTKYVRDALNNFGGNVRMLRSLIII